MEKEETSWRITEEGPLSPGDGNAIDVTCNEHNNMTHSIVDTRTPNMRTEANTGT